MSKFISSRKLTENITISYCNDGYWIYDKIQGYNIAMREKTEEEAFAKCFDSYQKNILMLKKENNILNDKIESILKILIIEE